MVDHNSHDALLNRELAKANFRELIQAACTLLQEDVNYATNALYRTYDASDNEGDARWALLALYYHCIEMTDGIEILVSQSSGVPAKPLVRSSYEATLSLEYILMADYEQRALSWLVGYIHNKQDMHAKIISSTPEGIKFRQEISKDTMSHSVFSLLTPEMEADSLNKFNQAEDLLKQSHFQPIEAEYQKLKPKNNNYPNWFSLFNGPRSIRKLAEKLGRLSEYEIIYSNMSEVTHAKDLTRLIGDKKNKVFGFTPLRSDTDALIDVTVLGSHFLHRATRLMLSKFRPGEEDSYLKWEQEQKIRVKHIQEVRDAYPSIYKV